MLDVLKIFISVAKNKYWFLEDTAIIYILICDIWTQTKRLEFVDLEQRPSSFSGNHFVFYDDQ